MELLACQAGSRGLDPCRKGRVRAGTTVIRMTPRVRHLITLVVAFAALALPAAAAADPDTVVRDCAADGSVDGDYSDSDKRAALKRIPADLDEYSDCRSVIGAAIGGGPKARASNNDRAAAGAAGGGGAAGKAVTAKKRKARAEKRKKERASTELALGDRKVDPRNSDVFQAADTSNGLPTPVLLALIALGLLAMAGGVMALGKRNQGLAATLRRVPLPFLRR